MVIREIDKNDFGTAVYGRYNFLVLTQTVDECLRRGRTS